jgi:hypothetical protein
MTPAKRDLGVLAQYGACWSRGREEERGGRRPAAPIISRTAEPARSQQDASSARPRRPRVTSEQVEAFTWPPQRAAPR